MKNKLFDVVYSENVKILKNFTSIETDKKEAQYTYK